MAIKMIKIYSGLKRISIPLLLVETLPFSRKSEQYAVSMHMNRDRTKRGAGGGEWFLDQSLVYKIQNQPI